jgi:hypothetical protein
MFDPLMLLIPLVVLVLVLMFGFAGCQIVFPLNPVLCIRLQAPAALTVTQIVFEFVPPGAAVPPVVKTSPTPDSTEDADNFFLECRDPASGAWTVRCRVTVTDNGQTKTAMATGNFTLEEDASGQAQFAAGLNPAGGLVVAFLGLA